MKSLFTFYLLFTIILCSVALPVYAKDSEALQPINLMFDAMREHNSDKFLAQFLTTAKLERLTKANEVKSSNLNNFATFIATSTQHLDEQLFNIQLQVSGKLANAWTPFAFYVDGKLSHCGVNSFQLIKQQGQWKIQYLIDNVHTGSCESFIASHKAQEK